MVLDKFDMVDMGGIDLLEAQGIAVPGLYQKLVESITLCRYQTLYNWYFLGIQIAPSYVELEVREGGVWINEGVMIDENDVVHIASIEPEPPAPIVPEIQPLTVIENGEYYAPVGVDGYNPVIVNIENEGITVEKLFESETPVTQGTLESSILGYKLILVTCRQTSSTRAIDGVVVTPEVAISGVGVGCTIGQAYCYIKFNTETTFTPDVSGSCGVIAIYGIM